MGTTYTVEIRQFTPYGDYWTPVKKRRWGSQKVVFETQADAEFYVNYLVAVHGVARGRLRVVQETRGVVSE